MSKEKEKCELEEREKIEKMEKELEVWRDWLKLETTMDSVPLGLKTKS